MLVLINVLLPDQFYSISDLNERQWIGLKESKKDEKWKNKLEQARKKGIRMVTYFDPEYPAQNAITFSSTL